MMKNQAQDQSLAVTDTSFQEEVLQSDIPVLVDFWAEWCGPCRIVGPTVDALASEYQGRIKVVKLNVDENPDTANGFGIRSIPTLMVFEAGVRKETVVGVQPKAQLNQLIEPYAA
jgi:thioredoxin 1